MLPTDRGGESADSPVTSSGYVIWDGQYLPPPYEITVEADEIFLNGRLLPPISADSMKVRRGQGPRSRMATNSMPTSHTYQATLQRGLQRDGLLLVDSNQAHLMRALEAEYVLDVLLAETDLEVAAKLLMSYFGGADSPGFNVDWKHVAHSFVPTNELRDRRPVQPPPPDAEFAATDSMISTRTIQYGMTVMGMALGVLGFGMILQHRPHIHLRGASNRIDGEGEGFQMLPCYVLLLVILAGFDLACTLFASGSGGLFELNPLGNSLLNKPLSLMGVKLSATFVSAGILFRLRPYRIAQAASWWLCLVFVMLTLRWVVFSSMFMS
jgi:hypothetical protein